MLTRNLKIAASILAVFCFVAFGSEAVVPSSQLAQVPEDQGTNYNPYTGGNNPYDTGSNQGTPKQYGSVGDASFDDFPTYVNNPTPPSRPSNAPYSDCLDARDCQTQINGGVPSSGSGLFGQTNTTSLGGTNSVSLGGNNNTSFGGTNPSGGGIITLQNPLKAKSIGELLRALIDIMIVFAIPLIVMMIIYAGFLYVTARGNESKITTAHWALTSAIIGGLLILGAEMLITVIQGTVNQLR